MQFYLDESGDLGWKFTHPYRHGGSSRHLTIATLCVDPSISHMPRRLIRNLYRKFNWSPAKEKKWADMNPTSRLWFAQEAVKLITTQGGLIRYCSITVHKPNVQSHIRADGNKLYNYMIGLSLLDEMSQHPVAEFYPDERAVKVASGNSLHDYVQTMLWLERSVPTVLVTTNSDSSQEQNIQFADMLSGIVQHHFEDGKSEPWNVLNPVLQHKRLFFR